MNMPPDNSPQRKEGKKRKGRKERKKHGNSPTISSTVPFFDWPLHEGVKINLKINQITYSYILVTEQWSSRDNNERVITFNN
jgi:hypothetical protein